MNESLENVYARRIGGRLFLLMNSMAGDQGPVRVFRFDSARTGEIAIPCARVGDLRDGTESIWIDADLNGRADSGETLSQAYTDYPYKTAFWPDSRGNLWQAYREHGIRKIECAGLDARGLPRYRWQPRVFFPMPPPFTDVHKLRYVPETDTMYLAGWTKNNPGPGTDQPGALGSIARFDHWSGSPQLIWESAAEDRDTLAHCACFDIAGDYVFAVYGSPDKQTVYAFSLADGHRAAEWDPGPSVGGRGGWVDIWDGGIRAHRRADGEYLIFVEEDWHAKTLLYRWRPADGPQRP